MNSMIYLPLAAALAALVAWLLLDSTFHDRPTVRGEILLVNAEPFNESPGVLSLTVGSIELRIDPRFVVFEPGTDGQPAIASVDDLKVGMRVEASGVAQLNHLRAFAIRPTSAPPTPAGALTRSALSVLLFPLTAALIAFALLLAEGLTTRNWVRMIERALLGSLLATVFSMLAYLPAVLTMWIGQSFVNSQAHTHGGQPITAGNLGAIAFLVFTACRSAAWAWIGAATGLGMNLVRATRTQLRNTVIGGALGGALGGVFFDPISRFVSSEFANGSTSRLVGLLAVGLSIGIFVALIERLARDAWLRVRTGPLAGKSFILYKTPTIIGNAPQADVYLFKDAEIDPSHASVHRVGTGYEIEDMATRMGTSVGGSKIRRRRLVSGDQIIIGSTILDFEERQKRTPVA